MRPRFTLLALFVVAPSLLAQTHWAFQKPVRTAAPTVKNAAWVRTSIDAFVLARMEAAGLAPAAPADRLTLLRRVTFDLIGLPPTPEEADAFLNDPRPDAYDRVVDRLLASPHHGERWAQHWLDVVRYADSNGYELDADRPHAWLYRDYVVRALNLDSPYDRFLTEQLAGDLLARGQDPRQAADLHVATGFNRCGPIHLVSGNIDPDESRQEVLTEMTSTVGLAVLGLTVGCARCHDHKFDPLPQADYYRLQAFFAACQPREFDLATADERAAVLKRKTEIDARIAPIQKQVQEMDAPARAKVRAAKLARLEPIYRDAMAVEAKKRTPEQKKLVADADTLLKVTWDEVLDQLTPAEREKRLALRARIHALEAEKPPPPPRAWSVGDEEKVPTTFVLKRGDPKRRGEAVQPASPHALGDGVASSRLTRLDLATWLTRPDHPLTARVMVNRLWHHHFGRGLVATPNDFGLRGALPTHPELLDWLATELVAGGWSLKAMHRTMVLSATYRQASRNEAAEKADPANRLVARMNRRRLEGESLRDAVLAATGRLNRTLAGPPVRTPLEPEVYDLIFTEGEPDGLWYVTPDAREHDRRSLYLFLKRNVKLPLLEAFDQPDTLSSCPVRPVSTFAPQALILLNGPFMQEQSRQFAARLLRESSDVGQQIDRAHRLALGRPPRPEEATLSRTFLASQAKLLHDRLRWRQPVAVPDGLPAGADPAHAAALVDFCLAILNRNDMIYVP